MAHLYFLMRVPGQADRVLVWDTRTLSIGRASENDLTIEDEEVSRKHALLVNEGGVFEIGDYRTGNGTFVNGKRVRQKQRFEPGDAIGIGKLQLEFQASREHPAKLGHKLEYASQLKTAGNRSHRAPPQAQGTPRRRPDHRRGVPGQARRDPRGDVTDRGSPPLALARSSARSSAAAIR
jgi:predicted component of type VI protein secretion system